MASPAPSHRVDDVIGIGERTFNACAYAEGDRVLLWLRHERPEDEPIAEVINTGWLLGPLRLLTGARDRTGFAFEQVGTVFQHEAPDEFGAGVHDRVQLYYVDDDAEITAVDYARLLGHAGAVATSGPLEAAQRDGTRIKELAALLLQLGPRAPDRSPGASQRRPTGLR